MVEWPCAYVVIDLNSVHVPHRVWPRRGEGRGSKGHLSNGLWEGKTPRYYIEVKSTLSHCQTSFHASQGQPERVSVSNRSKTFKSQR